MREKKIKTSVMSQVPMPRDLFSESLNPAIKKGLGKMFTGSLDHIPDLDIRSDQSCYEAQTLLWLLFEQYLVKSVENNLLNSWHVEEDAQERLFLLNGINVSNCQNLWKSFSKELNAMDGGPGIEVAEPIFINKNTLLEGGEVKFATAMRFWPEEALPVRLDGTKCGGARFRRQSSPGYIELLKKHGDKPYFSSGWLWVPSGKKKEGFRISGMPHLLFKDGADTLHYFKELQLRDYERQIDNLEKNSNDYSASLHKLSAMRRSVAQFKAWLNNASLYNSLDLIRCIFEAWYRQKEHWYNQQLCIDGETVIDIQPWRLICLPHEDLRIRLDPKLELGKNWRQLIFNRFEALTTFERQIRTAEGKKVDMGDRFIQRAIDGRQDDLERLSPQGESSSALVSLLRNKNAIPKNNFYLEVSLDFMATLVDMACDNRGHFYFAHKALFVKNAKPLQAKRVEDPEPEQLKRIRKNNLGKDSPRLLAVSNLENWQHNRKVLASVLLQEITPSYEVRQTKNGKTFRKKLIDKDGCSEKVREINSKKYLECNGAFARGYQLRTWMGKAHYEATRKKSLKEQITLFINDVDCLMQEPFHLRISLDMKQSLLHDQEAIKHLRKLTHVSTKILPLILKMYIPVKLEDYLRERLLEAGIDAVDELPPKARHNEEMPLKIKELRLDRGLNQEQLAHLVGVSRITITNWEGGKKAVSPENLLKLKDVLQDQNNFLAL